MGEYSITEGKIEKTIIRITNATTNPTIRTPPPNPNHLTRPQTPQTLTRSPTFHNPTLHIIPHPKTNPLQTTPFPNIKI